MFQRFLRDRRGSNTTSSAVLIALGVVIGLAVLGVLGHALYTYFQSFGNCLNGC